jgi:hypothetical protein
MDLNIQHRCKELTFRRVFYWYLGLSEGTCVVLPLKAFILILPFSVSVSASFTGES